MSIEFDFSPKLVDENSKVLDLITVVRAPHRLQQTAVWNDLTSMGDHVLQQLEFFWIRCSFRSRPVTCRVSKSTIVPSSTSKADRSFTTGFLLATAWMRARAPVNRTACDVVIGAGLQGSNLVPLRSPDRDNDNRYLRASADRTARRNSI